MALTLVTSDLIVGLDYSKLSGTVTTWNQNTTGTAAGLSATLVVGSGGTGVTSITALKNVLDDETWTFANNITATGTLTVNGTGNSAFSGDLYIVGKKLDISAPSGGNAYVKFSDTNSGAKIWRVGTSLSSRGVFNIYNQTDNSFPFNILANGNVGIGTTSPSARLTVKDSVDNTFDSGIAIIRSASSQTGYINMKGGAMNFNSPSIPIVFRQAGSAKLSISSGGDTTITTTTNQGGLTVTSATDNTTLRVINTATNGKDWRFYSTGGSSGLGAGKLFIKVGTTETAARLVSFVDGGSDIKVGIGTASPGDKLEVNGNILLGTTNKVGWRYSSGNTSYNFITGEDQILTLTGGAWTSSATQVAVRIKTQQGQKVSVLNSGNVGIGTTSPSSKLQIHTATNAGNPEVAAFLVNKSTATNTEVRLAFAAHTNDIISTGRYSYISAKNTSNSNGQALVFATNATGASATPKLTITSGGNVGIGTSSPNVKLDIKGIAGSPAASGTTQNGIFRIQNASNNNTLDIGQIAGSPYGTWLQAADKTSLDTTNVYPILLNPSGGNVGIGTTSPSSKLDVQGATGTRNYNSTSGQISSIYETSRYYTANGNTTTNISIVTTTAFPTMGGGGYILVEVSASGYGGSGSNGLVFSWIGGGYGGHYHIPASYHPVEIIADTHHSSCNVSVYYPSYNNVGITISNASATTIAGIMRVKITTTY